MQRKLLIVEESLKDLKGHWFELLKVTHDSAVRRGWKTDIACNRNAAQIIRETFSVWPIFKHARYIDKPRKNFLGRKYYGFLIHNYRSLRAIWPVLKREEQYDAVFVSTVLVHHLFMWYFIMRLHPRPPKKLVLFFITNPGLWDAKSQIPYLPKSSIVTKFAVKLFSKMVHARKVDLAVGTKRSQKEFENLCGLPFHFIPQPVTIDFKKFDNSLYVNESPVLTFSCLGFARYEKGSDILKFAVEKILLHFPNFDARFIIQWMDDFTLPDGSVCEPGRVLENNQKVTLVKKTLTTTEYQNILVQCHCIILPYRNSSYYARVSQIATEAICLGLPIIYTMGGWLEDAVTEFGAGVGIPEESVEELVSAILKIFHCHSEYALQAKRRIEQARTFYSAESFTQSILKE